MAFLNSIRRRRLKRLGAFFLVIFLVMFTLRQAYAGAVVWVERQLTGQRWIGITSDFTGQYLAGVSREDIYVSDDYGAAWRKADGDIPGNVHTWTSIASSADGTVLVATESGGYVWVSGNRGENWVSEAVYGNWSSATITESGGYAAAINNDTHAVWVTHAGLDDWEEDNPTVASWSAVAYSPSGSLIFATEAAGYIFVSENHARDWAPTAAGLGNWNAITAWDTGAAAVAPNTNIEILTDNGATANQAAVTSFGNWSSIASAADGSILIAGPTHDNSNNYYAPYVSLDGGSNWNEVSGPEQDPWAGVASNSDGSFLAAAGYGNVWTVPGFGPDVGTVSIVSEADDETLAKAGDSAAVFFADTVTPLITPTISVNGNPSVDAQSEGDGVWGIEYTFPDTDPEGVVTFSITVGNVDGTATSTITETNDGSQVFLDLTKPVITLTGPSSVSINTGSSYTDSGATASDTHDGDLTGDINVSGTVDTSTPGVYTLSYDVNDHAGNQADTVTRTVTVANGTSHRTPHTSSGGSIYRAPTIAQNNPAPVTPVVPTHIFTFTQNLSVGASGPDVYLLQQFLVTKNTGPAAKKLADHGLTHYFGQLTQAAVAEYQAAHGISPAAGYFGPITRNFVNSQ